MLCGVGRSLWRWSKYPYRVRRTRQTYMQVRSSMSVLPIPRLQRTFDMRSRKGTTTFSLAAPSPVMYIHSPLADGLGTLRYCTSCCPAKLIQMPSHVLCWLADTSPYWACQSRRRYRRQEQHTRRGDAGWGHTRTAYIDWVHIRRRDD